MSYLESEARLHVRQAVLGELGYLAEAAPHAWSPENVETLVEFTRASRHNAATTTTALAVLSSLTAAPALPRITLTPGSDSGLVSQCIQIVIKLLLYRLIVDLYYFNVAMTNKIA